MPTNNLPSYSVENPTQEGIKENVIVWTEERPNLRLVVVYSSAGNPPRAVLERCDKQDAVGEDVYLEVNDKEGWWNIKDTILKALAIASAQDYGVMEN